MSLEDWIKSKPNPSQLTLDDLQKSIDAIARMPPDPCRLGKHIVSAEALRKPGYYRCGSCGAVVKTERRA